MLWNDNSDLYMAVKEPDGYRGKIFETSWSVWPTWESWNWAGWEGKPIDVEVYTKLPEVKLYLNDKLVDTKAVDRSTEFKAVFTVPYEAGTLRAEAGGKNVSLATAGEPARLRLTADRQVITGDGQDLAYIAQGQLLSFASADLKDREPYTTPRVTTWKGRAMLVVRSSKAKGKALVTVKSTLPAATLTIQSVTPSK